MTTEKSKFPEPATPNLGEIVQAWLEGKRVQHLYSGTEEWGDVKPRARSTNEALPFWTGVKYRIAPEPHHHKALIEKWVEAPDEYVVKWRQHLAWHETSYPCFGPKCDYHLFNKATGDLVMESPAKPD